MADRQQGELLVMGGKEGIAYDNKRVHLKLDSRSQKRHRYRGRYLLAEHGVAAQGCVPPPVHL